MLNYLQRTNHFGGRKLNNVRNDMQGADEYAKLFETGQYNRLYIVSGKHARGATFRIFVIPSDAEAVYNGPNNPPRNEDAIEVYGVVSGQPGWDETYGWIHKGPWQADFDDMVVERQAELRALGILNDALETQRRKQQQDITAELLSSYERHEPNGKESRLERDASTEVGGSSPSMPANPHVTLFSVLKFYARKVDNIKSPLASDRTIASVLGHIVAEVGELSEEVTIESGYSYKKPGEDGVVGEAVDVILAAMDLIHVYRPELTEADIIKIANRKCTKWKSKLMEHTYVK
jgi:NTP pyrophosphatase (non-canonical NTP hydrolase)